MRVENVNKFNPLIRAIETRVKHFISLIQTYKTKYYISTVFIFHKQRKCSNIFPYKTYIWSMLKNKTIFFHISKYNIRRKLFSFTKYTLIFLTLKKHSKSWRTYSSANIISYTTSIIDYLSKSINLTILKIFYLVLVILINFLCQHYFQLLKQ